MNVSFAIQGMGKATFHRRGMELGGRTSVLECYTSLSHPLLKIISKHCLGRHKYGEKNSRCWFMEASMNEITSVTEKGIHYLDDEDKSQFIDFEACYQKFLAYTRKSMGARFTDEDEEFYKTWKSVGVRHALSRPQTLQFFTVPPVDFVFTTEEPFWRVLVGIKKAGYRTTDGD